MAMDVNGSTETHILETIYDIVELVDVFLTFFGLLMALYYTRCVLRSSLIHVNLKFILLAASFYFNMSAFSRVFLRNSDPDSSNYDVILLLCNIGNIGATGGLNLVIISIVIERFLSTIYAATYDERGWRFGAIFVLVHISYFISYVVVTLLYEETMAADYMAVPNEPCILYKRPIILSVVWIIYPTITMPFLPLLYSIFMLNKRKNQRLIDYDLGIRFQYQQNINTLRQAIRISVVVAFISMVGIVCVLIILYKMVVLKETEITWTYKLLLNLPGIALDLDNFAFSILWLLWYNPLYCTVKSDIALLIAASDDEPEERSSMKRERIRQETDVYFSQLAKSWDAQYGPAPIK
ncbi:unnamed protein product [Bursaphelenchus xylophilus]|uniref:(pine wood nematode) hypothetical protein n=1 Tax=Bursaphelenchus xylophilus TaxID=6326 RepID=A0A1I7SDG6_BURXY|nr:unnamed protein product [Bursaphelenchus xylophilus]CAG9131688.1 unnamed protein product [Bursaphelenchus xylophilus]